MAREYLKTHGKAGKLESSTSPYLLLLFLYPLSKRTEATKVSAALTASLTSSPSFIIFVAPG